MNLSTYAFDDATITSITQKTNSLDFTIEDVSTPNNKKENGHLIFQEIKNITIDDAPSSQIIMIYPDGEIMDLEQEDDNTSIIIVWNDFKQQLSKTNVYNIKSSSTLWEAS